MITKQQSENIDLAEKGIKSPLNPTNDGMKADSKEEKVVVQIAKNLKKTEDLHSIHHKKREKPIVSQSEQPSPNKSQAV